MYRDVVPTAKSVHRMSMVTPSVRLIAITGSFSGRFIKMVLHASGFIGSNYCVRLHNDLCLGVLLNAVTTATYLDMRRRGFDISALRYEDLVARPLDMCRVILEFCHLPVSLAELVVKAFDVDSQRNSTIARSSIGQFTEPQLGPKTEEELNEILKKFAVPLIGEPNVLEGTISCI